MTDPLFRPVITVVRPSPDASVIEVTLDMNGWIADGVAEVTDEDLLLAACEATCDAVNRFLPEGTTVSITFARHLDGPEVPRPVVLTSVVFDDGGAPPEEELLGAAWVRSDLQVAGVRATLDGLSRRLSPFVP